eukprot:11227317-Alexandrium_andersonii.AAC.1
MPGQNPEAQCMTSTPSVLQTIIANAGMMWTDAAPYNPRWFCPCELLVAQGVPAYGFLEPGRSANSFSVERTDRRRSGVIKQAGTAL